jgi:uncharacterized membrane-anchored protein YhcB (DUF1043 family)
MEVLSFALGMVAMVAIALVIVIVVGIVKVFRQQRELKSTQEWVSNLERTVWSRFDEVDKNFSRRENNIYNALADNGRDLHQQIEQAYTNARDMANAYTDSRIDKLSGTLGAKQVIKG